MIEPLIVARAVHLAASTAIFGMLFFDLIIARPVVAIEKNGSARDYFRALNRLIWISLAIAAASGLVWAMLLAAQIGGTTIGQALTGGTLATLLTETRFGYLWIARGALTAVVALTLLPQRGRFASLGLLCAAIALVMLAWTGHAGAQLGAIGWLHVCADMGHLLTAGAWLGGLPALALLLAKSDEISLASFSGVTRRFSAFGMAAVAVLLTSGIINTWALTDSVNALTTSAYGRLLLVKVGLFLAMVGFAAVNRWYWTPRLPAARAATMIQRYSLVEFGIGLIVICIVGALGTLPPPSHQHSHAGAAASEAAFVHIHDVQAMADVTIAPGHAGPSDVQIRLMQDDFTPLVARSVTVRLSQSKQQTLAVEARRGDAAGLWRAPGVLLPNAGIWTVVVDVHTDHGRPITLDAPVVLEP